MSAVESPPRRLMSVPEVAAHFFCCERTVWRLLERGALNKVMVGHAARVTPESVDAFIENGGAA